VGLTRAHRTVALTLALTLVAVGGAVAARQLLDRSPRFTDPTLTETQASQVAAGLATALDDLAARFLVGDPATEHLQVLRWDDDVATAPERFAEHLGMIGDASAFVHANAVELERRRDLGAVTAVETRVVGTTPLGVDDAHADWVQVDVVQDETLDAGQTSTAVSYGVAVRAGAIVDVRDLDGLLTGASSSAGPVAEGFVAAVLAGDERAVERHTAQTGVTDRELATLRAWLAAAGDIEVAELPASRMGSLQVAYAVPQRGPLVRFEVTLGATPQVTWETIGAR